MSAVKEHYDNHLGNFYSWMLGDFETRRQEQQDFFVRHSIAPGKSSVAIDLGSGNGIQSVALARLGFSVRAIDFNKTLNDEHRNIKGNLDIEVIDADILAFADHSPSEVDLVVCMGDTLTHLPDQKSVSMLINEMATILTAGGKLILSFRDLSVDLIGTRRLIPVRSTDNRIHTCFLEYFPLHVMVTDILHEKKDGEWKLTASSYPKLRLTSDAVKGFLSDSGFTLVASETVKGLQFFVASRKPQN